VARRRSKAMVGSNGRKGHRRGSTDGGEDGGGEARSKKGWTEAAWWSSPWVRKKRRQSSNYGEGQWRFLHRWDERSREGEGHLRHALKGE
jgi:hypothetical protein